MISHLVAARVLSGPAAIAGLLSAQLAGAQVVATATLSVLPIEGVAGGILAPASVSAAGRVRLSAIAGPVLDSASLGTAARLALRAAATVVAADASVSSAGRISVRAALSQPLAPASINAAAVLVSVEVKTFLARQVGAQAKVSALLPASASGVSGDLSPASRAARAPATLPLAAASGSPVGAASVSTVIGPLSRSIRLS